MDNQTTESAMYAGKTYSRLLFMVTWRDHSIDAAIKALSDDINPDFRWWHTPAGKYISYAGPDHLQRIYETGPHVRSCMSLDIDMLSPEAEYYELKYNHYALNIIECFMLDVDRWLWAESTRSIAKNSAFISSTTERPHPLVRYRRSLFFVDGDLYNKHYGTTYSSIIPSSDFAERAESFLNKHADQLLQHDHADYCFPNQPSSPPRFTLE